MPRVCFVLIAGLDQALLSRAGKLPLLSTLQHRVAYEPPLPAVTCTTQATLTTGVTPDQQLASAHSTLLAC